MAQFDVYRNPNAASRARIPYLLDVQPGLLDPLATRIVVPRKALGEPVGNLASERAAIIAALDLALTGI